MNGNRKHLYRSCTDRILAGVCGGLGEYFDIDPLIFRLLFIFFGLQGVGILAYIIFALVVPADPNCDHHPHKEEAKAKMGEFVESFKEGVNEAANNIRSRERRPGTGRYLLAIILIAIGVFALLDLYLPFNLFRWRIIWPLIFVFLGLLLITRRSHRD